MNEGQAIHWFRDVGADDRNTVGGKGASLGELLRAGAAVPQGFCVSVDPFRHFAVGADPGLHARIESLRGAASETIAKVCAETRAAILREPVPAALRAEIESAYAELCEGERDFPVAVRSSATSEDHADASFAGMQDTYLWVIGGEALVDAIRSCWASLYSVESVTYRLRLAIPEPEVAMGVVVQRMVDARSAGVMFTRSPLTGDKSVIVIEGAWGLGSSVVSGDVTPDRFVVSKITGNISARTISDKRIEHVPDRMAAQVREREVTAALRQLPCLSDAEIAALVATAKAVERHYGMAMDIEWAVDRSDAARILLLQARPETVWNNRDKEAAPSVQPAAQPFAHVLRTFSSRSGPK